MRKGVSFTLVIIVSSMVMIIAAATLTISSQSLLGDIGSFLREGSPQPLEEARNYCLEHKLQGCSSIGDDGNPGEWAKKVSYQGRTCWEWAEEEEVFGSEGTDNIPPC